jgi:hypothetical protein
MQSVVVIIILLRTADKRSRNHLNNEDLIEKRYKIASYSS